MKLELILSIALASALLYKTVSASSSTCQDQRMNSLVVSNVKAIVLKCIDKAHRIHRDAVRHAKYKGYMYSFRDIGFEPSTFPRTTCGSLIYSADKNEFNTPIGTIYGPPPLRSNVKDYILDQLIKEYHMVKLTGTKETLYVVPLDTSVGAVIPTNCFEGKFRENESNLLQRATREASLDGFQAWLEANSQNSYSIPFSTPTMLEMQAKAVLDYYGENSLRTIEYRRVHYHLDVAAHMVQSMKKGIPRGEHLINLYDAHEKFFYDNCVMLNHQGKWVVDRDLAKVHDSYKADMNTPSMEENLIRADAAFRLCRDLKKPIEPALTALSTLEYGRFVQYHVKIASNVLRRVKEGLNGGKHLVDLEMEREMYDVIFHASHPDRTNRIASYDESNHSQKMKEKLERTDELFMKIWKNKDNWESVLDECSKFHERHVVKKIAEILQLV